MMRAESTTENSVQSMIAFRQTRYDALNLKRFPFEYFWQALSNKIVSSVKVPTHA